MKPENLKYVAVAIGVLILALCAVNLYYVRSLHEKHTLLVQMANENNEMAMIASVNSGVVLNLLDVILFDENLHKKFIAKQKVDSIYKVNSQIYNQLALLSIQVNCRKEFDELRAQREYATTLRLKAANLAFAGRTREAKEVIEKEFSPSLVLFFKQLNNYVKLVNKQIGNLEEPKLDITKEIIVINKRLILIPILIIILGIAFALTGFFYMTQEDDE